MKRKATGCVLVGLAASAAGVVRADDPILLATMRADVGVGRRQASAMYSPVLFYVLGIQPSDTIVLFEDHTFPSGNPVTISDVTSASDEQDFFAFAATLTDGIDNSIGSGAWHEVTGLIGGAGGPESQRIDLLVPSFGPDLVGYTIDHISREVTVFAESPGSDPFGDGIWTDWTMTGSYEIYGWAIPEPITGLQLGLPGLLLLCHRRNKHPLQQSHTSTVTHFT